MATAPKFEPATPRPRRDGWSAERQIRFIEALAEGATVDAAARRVGMTRDSAYKLARRPCGRSFRQGWDAAIDCNMPQVEQAAVRRSIEGVARPVFYKGEQVGEWRHHDERLTMFLLRSRRPDRYGKSIEHMPAPDPEYYHPDAGIRLDGPITDLEFNGPGEEGNPADENDEPAQPARETGEHDHDPPGA
jgi:hypothetical protein